MGRDRPRGLSLTGDGYEPLEVGPRQLEPGQPSVKANARVVAVEADGVGQVWVATDRGLYVTDGENGGKASSATTAFHMKP